MTIFKNFKDISGSHTESENKVFQKLLTDWLTRAQTAFERGDVDLLVDLFDQEGYWRDILILDFDFNSLKKDQIKAYIQLLNLKLPSIQNLSLVKPELIKIVQLLPNLHVLEGFIEFETEFCRGTGLIRLRLPFTSELVQEVHHLKAFTFFVKSSMFNSFFNLERYMKTDFNT
ncbi:hypothetical protein DFH28DRAFT_966103 [Melampsora americana]|nr:hypothetical protein DFH28DRAFT_966103 [Melampsora americana]